ncbi:sporulation protein YpjB [Paraliobacillus ryukyuensis]|uniref:sporulation protein YpjB n=1 Tax=Paraliobacillus ryukyuensis TaxID=200904 RepID=UPI0009A87280|nr:sporulation protein YpjB [Paraliobacillus ryukyuensis]
MKKMMTKYMTSFIFVLSIIFIVLGSKQILMTQEKESSSVSYTYERYVTEQQYSLAEQWLSTHTEEIDSMMYTENQQVQAIINELISHNLDTVMRDDVPASYKVNAARSLVIALDAIKQHDDPLWMKSKQALDKSLQSVIETGNYSSERLEDILTHWQMLQPALQIVLSEEDFSALNEAFSQLNVESVNAVQNTKAVFKQSQLIDVQTTTQGDPLSFYWIILMVGGAIIVTLSYVAWRKYKAEKKRKQKQPFN